jgi:Hydantoinase/oxoprolinase N-terminal region/Hydantoinase B/oxoprolinase/Hydantoinase/oxoprolinase
MSYRLGVDVGGTFTDLVLVGPGGRARARKVLSSAGNYAEAIVRGTRELMAAAAIGASDVGELIHGTTVATNAILERRGARTGLLTTEGFRDLLEIGRLRLARLYDIDFERPPPLVPRRWRREVVERLGPRGEVLMPLDRESVVAAVDLLAREGVESVAIAFLHAYASDAHEQATAAIVRERAPGLLLTLSSEILPEVREFERTSTAVTNAYVMPVMSRYLGSLETELRALGVGAPILVMQSNGGVMTAASGRRRPGPRDRVGAGGGRDRAGGAHAPDRPGERDQHRHGRDHRQGLGHRGRRAQADGRVCYLPDSGGAGRFRGGLALVREYRFEEAEGALQLRTDRRRHLPYGLQGGRDGTPSANLLNPGTPAARDLPAKCTLTLRRGDVFRHVYAVRAAGATR